ncbi:hypothetical protein CLV86_0237 [Lacinutrix venerupis]|nr:hypothetical protein [Lacinutrix venerupis]RLJ68848.1 hypothetical protein CLV86_0237 [Lacinutrix venerupis]
MKAIINNLRRTNCITENNLHVSREILKFSNTTNGLWNGAKRYAY